MKKEIEPQHFELPDAYSYSKYSVGALEGISSIQSITPATMFPMTNCRSQNSLSNPAYQATGSSPQLTPNRDFSIRFSQRDNMHDQRNSYHVNANSNPRHQQSNDVVYEPLGAKSTPFEQDSRDRSSQNAGIKSH